MVLVILAEQLSVDLNFEKGRSNANSLDVIICRILEMSFDKMSRIVDWLNDLAIKLNLDLTECANLAWNEIKNRKGETVNGTFIKD